VSKLKVFIISLLVLASAIAGCGPSASPLVTPAPAAESDTITAAVQSAIKSFLSNDFASAQKNMRLLPAEQKDPQTQLMFADFSLHLNRRLALEAKDAGLNAPSPFISVSNVRAAETSGMLADVGIQPATGLEPLTLTVKATLVSGSWMIDFAPFILALIDSLGEE